MNLLTSSLYVTLTKSITCLMGASRKVTSISSTNPHSLGLIRLWKIWNIYITSLKIFCNDLLQNRRRKTRANSSPALMPSIACIPHSAFSPWSCHEAGDERAAKLPFGKRWFRVSLPGFDHPYKIASECEQSSKWLFLLWKLCPLSVTLKLAFWSYVTATCGLFFCGMVKKWFNLFLPLEGM